MIMTIVDSGGKLPKGAAAAVLAMLAYVAAASIVAGLGNLGSGLLVLIMGGITVGVVDYVMWKDVARERAASGGLEPSATSVGSYVYGGWESPYSPEMPATIHGFHAVRTEGAGPDPVTAPAPASAPTPTPANDEGPAEPADPAPATGTAEVQADDVGTRPPTLEAPRGEADDLKRINGIGPTNEKKLNGLGIYHFDQIAAWDEAQVRWVGAYLAFPGRIEREDWVTQARALATTSDATAEASAATSSTA
ncbi:hypothetical protein [Salinarimonas ramus]|uniref:Uncharacterized protein n=1 Tax=Salinarimonas ramus TaxID=690164 RepID=A0A917QEF1_9HYPH|nr:hypothetical protein [Salinarimonas ramus]GGK46732.1 hypothetical protein GCM10011322_37250 [Salinarimonas ramus]